MGQGLTDLNRDIEPYRLLDWLERLGWFVAIQAGFAGDGVLVLASRGERRVEKQGRSVAEVAGDLVRECLVAL